MGRHNRNLALLSTCLESRKIVKSVYTRVLSPTYNTTATNMEFIWVDLDNDIIVRDLSTPDSDKPLKTLFDRTTTDFNAGCFRVFTGLAKVKHLAVAFDVLRQNGGSFFVVLQACAPKLETLTIIPSSKVVFRRQKIEAESSAGRHHHRDSSEPLSAVQNLVPKLRRLLGRYLESKDQCCSRDDVE